jgi:hypothetical protein
LKKKKMKTNNVKDTIKTGVTSLAGMGIIGTTSSMPGMPAQASGTANVINTGLHLANVGQLAKTGIDIAKCMGKDCRLKKKWY